MQIKAVTKTVGNALDYREPVFAENRMKELSMHPSLPSRRPERNAEMPLRTHVKAA